MNRSKKQHTWAGAILTVVVALLLAACGGSSGKGATAGSSSATGLSKAASDPNATLTINASVAPATLDPSASGNDVELGWISSMYSTLTQPAHIAGPVPGTTEQDLDPKKVKPYLATSWQFSDNDETLTLHLRSGLKFPSGDPVDATAVKWSLERAIKNALGGDAVFQETQFKPPLVKSISAPNATTVVIHYSRPAPNQPAVLSSTETAIYDPKLIEAHGGVQEGKPNTWLASHDAGYGPYLLKSYQPGQRLIFEANPNFFEPPKNKRVIVNFVSSNETLLLQAKSGAADVTIGLSDQAAHSLTSNSCCTVVAGSSRRATFVNLPNLGNVEVFKNPDSRQALAYAVPYEAILQKIAYGYGTLFSGEWYPSFGWYDPSVGKPHEYNLAKAKELMKKSGVKTPAQVTIYVTIGDEVSKEIATIIAGSWQQLGVDAKVTPISLAQLFETEKKYEAASVETEGPLIVAPAYLWAYDLQCEPKNPDGVNVCSPEADKLMTEVQDGKFIDDPSKEQEVLNEVDEIYIKIPAKIWLYSTKFVSVLSKDMTSYYSSDTPEVRFWEKS